MNSWLLLLPAKRYHTELIVVGVTLLVLCTLPVMAIVGMTNVPALASDESLKLYTGVSSKDNRYDYGYCTWWVSKRRAEINVPIPQNWGDAHSWDDNALKDGYLVDHHPVVGAIAQTDAGALGHVMFVEEVKPDGSWVVSEMNSVGWDIMDTKTKAAKEAIWYNFIH